MVSAAGTTRLSKALSSLLVALSVVAFLVPDTADYLALVPGRTLPCVWNVVTSSFVTLNPIELVISVLGLLVLARLVEPVYGSKEFLKFIFLVAAVTGTTTFVALYIAFAATSSGSLLYGKICGFHGILAGLLVSLKQVMPLHELKLFGTARLKVKYVPSVLLLAVLVVATALGRQDYLAFYVTGTYVSWLYLRFFQQQPDSGHMGDAGDDFKFSSFFPPALEPLIDPVAAAASTVTRLRHAPGAAGGTGTGATAAHGLLASGGPSALGADAADASRRRERGAKALEERLGLKKGHGAGGDADEENGLLLPVPESPAK